MVFGTFDGLHPGHLNFFQQARNLSANPFLIVSVARDRNVFKIKGMRPDYSERQRLNLIKKHRLADRVVLAGLDRHLPHILKEGPNIIALGYDQKKYVQNLRKDLKNSGLMVKVFRLKPYKPHLYKNHLLKKKS